MTRDTETAEYCADQLKALSDPLRLQIIDLLRVGELAVGDIAGFLEAEVVIVSHHLQILKHARLVEPRRDGRFIFYRLRDGLLQKKAARAKPELDLGCCRIEVPATVTRK